MHNLYSYYTCDPFRMNIYALVRMKCIKRALIPKLMMFLLALCVVHKVYIGVCIHMIQLYHNSNVCVQ